MIVNEIRKREMGKEEFHMKFSSVNFSLTITPGKHVHREKHTLSDMRNFWLVEWNSTSNDVAREIHNF